MRILLQLLLLSSFVLYGHVADGQHDASLNLLSRSKRAQKAHSRTTTKHPTTTNQKQPCIIKPLQKPNFNVRNRRISESKCLEYIWNIKDRDNTNQQKARCFRYFVIGGRDTDPGEFPHMGAVGWKSKKGSWIFKCGSTLISSKFLLTAGHCSKVSSREPNVANTVPEIVRLGDKVIKDLAKNKLNVNDAKIRRIIVHPRYDSPKKYYDIAIIELQTKVMFDKYVQPACLWTKADFRSLGSKATLTGWGVIDTASLERSPQLQAADVDILESRVCDNLLKSSRSRLWRGMVESQMCAGKLAGGADSCQGDSGGPLQVKIKQPIKTEGEIHYIIGITSFGSGCARANKPAVYTRVSSFINWIESVVWK